MVIIGPCPLVGLLFVGAPVRLNMLNMPKSASVLSIFLSFLPRLISAAADWMSTILRPMVWPYCEFRMHV